MLGVLPMYWPSSLLGYEMRQELSKGQGAAWFVVLDVALPASTARYSFVGTAAATLGQYDGRLLELGSFVRSMSDRSFQMESLEEDCLVDDTSNVLAAAVFGANGKSVRGSVVTLRLGSPNVASSGWFVVFQGVLDQYRMERPHVWRLVLRPNDLPLRRRYPKPMISAADWPNAPDASLAQYGPLIYGAHDARTTTSTGAVPCVYVDDVGFRYLVCWGRAKSVDSVYKDGVLQSSGYTVTYPVVGGRVCTVIDFTSTMGNSAITADVQGYETVGDGSGTLITNPADQLKHELVNWVYGDYKSGAWLSSTGVPLNLAAFTQTGLFFRAFGHVGSRRVFGEQLTGLETLAEWASSWQTSLFWSNLGGLTPRVFDYRALSLYPDERWARGDRSPYEPNFRPDWEGLIDRVTLEYFYQHAASKYQRTLEVRDPTSTLPDAPDSLPLPWSAAYESEG